MRTREISRTVQDVGSGPRTGDTTTTIFECPCGKSTITYERDYIPGFKTRSVSIDCTVCKEKYDLDLSHGAANWELVPKA